MDAAKVAFQPLPRPEAAESFAAPKASPEAAGKSGKLQDALRDFEALFVNQLLTAMRRSVPEGGGVPKSAGSKLYQQMLDEQMSLAIARSGKGLGLAEMLQRQLGKEMAGE